MESLIQAITVLQLTPVYFWLLSFLLGAAIASFITCMSHRYMNAVEAEIKALKLELETNKEASNRNNQAGIYSSRSRCFFCGQKIPFYRNVPILGWLLGMGRSSCCKTNIPKSYVLSEIWLAAIFLTGACLLSSAQDLVIFWSIAALSYLIAEIDRTTLTIPFSLTSFTALSYSILTFYFNPHFLETTMVILLVGFLIGHLISLSKLSNSLIGNGDIYYIAFSAAIFLGAGSGVYFLSFLVITSVVFVLQNISSTRGEKPMGFSLHLSSTAVLLHHLYNF